MQRANYIEMYSWGRRGCDRMVIGLTLRYLHLLL